MGERFGFVPKELTSLCGVFVRRFHARNGYAGLPDLLWRSQARSFIENDDQFAHVFKKACKTKSAKRANHASLSIATMIIALEVLVRDVDGWGARFPEAKRAAEALLGASMESQRPWLMDSYL
jgi:hypothetical protein